MITDESDFIYGTDINNALNLIYNKAITQPGNEGKIFRFKVAAENVLGVGDYSEEI